MLQRRLAACLINVCVLATRTYRTHRAVGFKLKGFCMDCMFVDYKINVKWVFLNVARRGHHDMLLISECVCWHEQYVPEQRLT